MQESQRHYKDINKLGEYVLYPFSNENFIICNILLLQPFSPFCALVPHILYKHPFDFASHLKDCVTASACSNFDIGTSVPMPMAAARAVSNICILKATSCWDFFFENKSIKAKLIVWKGSSLGRKLCLNKFFLQYIFIWMGFSSIFPRYINSISILSPKQCLARAMRESWPSFMWVIYVLPSSWVVGNMGKAFEEFYEKHKRLSYVPGAEGHWKVCS